MGNSSLCMFNSCSLFLPSFPLSFSLLLSFLCLNSFPVSQFSSPLLRLFSLQSLCIFFFFPSSPPPHPLSPTNFDSPALLLYSFAPSLALSIPFYPSIFLLSLDSRNTYHISDRTVIADTALRKSCSIQPHENGLVNSDQHLQTAFSINRKSLAILCKYDS